ncbi:nuclear pore complex protein NUP1-like [Euphorbia lathyris]|uniref:nuclear pore complex protein NUP1-like n=1 Tax=Euphorbia lathyris TaxID=212925 RepID=UPI0033135368
MDTKDPTTMSFLPKPPQNGGAVGKFRKPTSRRPPATPYDRPSQNQAHRGRLLSKLLDPALRLVYGGANLLFPSFFSASKSALPSSTNLEENHEVLGNTNLHTEVEEQHDVAGDGNFTQKHVESSATQVAGSSSKLDLNEQQHNHKVEVSDPDGLSEIERLVKDKKFSRDEINRLVEIINSRVVDHPNIEQENKHTITQVGDLRGSGAIEYLGKSTGAKQEDLDTTLWETSNSKDKLFSCPISIDAGRPIPLENSRKSTKEKNEDPDKISWRSSTAILQSKRQDDIGSSPIDIARAYMGHRTSEVGFGTSSSISRDEETLPYSNELVVKPLPAPRTTPRWPGALVQDQHDYMTPQTQRKRFGLHNFPRTPYSRTIHSTTKSRLIQLQGNSDRHPSIMTNPFQQTTTPLEQVRLNSNALNGNHRSVGPIRRLRHKVNAETPARGSVNFRTPLNGVEKEYWSNSEGLFSAPKQNVENGRIDSQCSKPQNTEVFTPSVPAHSSRVARKILEHLDRNPPTVIEKSAELRLASSWKKQESGNKVNAVATASDIKVATALTRGDYAGPSQDLTKTQNAQQKGANEDVFKVPSDASASASASGVLSLQKKIPPRNSSAKPMLPNIAIDKPNQRWTFSSDNSLGFSFPVSAASGGSSEPPTPTFMPIFSVIGQSEGSSVPSYSFGSRESTPPYIFSFPSTSSSSIQEEDASDLEFNFGSGERRISFASIGHETVCC